MSATLKRWLAGVLLTTSMVLAACGTTTPAAPTSAPAAPTAAVPSAMRSELKYVTQPPPSTWSKS